MDIKLFKSQKFLSFLKLIAAAFLVGISLGITEVLLRKHLELKPSVQPPSVDLSPVQSQLANLELQIEKQSLIIKRLETENEAQTSLSKQLEKRLQAHTEIMKRMCEYVFVITVDKKIMPRHCLPDYNWRREEGS